MAEEVGAEALREELAACQRELALAREEAETGRETAHLLEKRLTERTAQLQSLSRRLVEFQERERRTLSRDLHDTSGQNITAMKLALGSLKRAEGCSDATRARVDELLKLADTVSEDLHRLAVNLRPSSLDRYGLVPALEQLLTEFHKLTGLEAGFVALGSHGEASSRLPGEVETALYRIVQEALTNIARYAQAGHVSVFLQETGDGIELIVEDDGRGFDVEEALRSGRLGLLGMRERAEMLGGRLEVESSPDRGTTIYATIPAHGEVAEGQGGAPDLWETSWSSPKPRTTHPVAAAAHAGVVEPRLAEAAELARAKALSDTLVEITAGMARQKDAENLLAYVLAGSAEAVGCDYADVVLREGDHWRISHGYRLHDSLIGQRLEDKDLPLAVQIERTGEMAVLNDIQAGSELNTAARTWGARSGVSIPLIASGGFVGVVAYFHDSAVVPFEPSEVEFLRRLSALVSLAMENIHLREIEARQRDELRQRVGELETLLALLRSASPSPKTPKAR